MLELLIGVIGGLSFGVSSVALYYELKFARLRDRLETIEESRLEFGEVCLAAARAKDDHEEGAHPAANREFIDGVDAVLGKLLEMDYGDDPLEMRLAYLAGGDTIEFDVDDVTHEDLADLADLIDEEVGDAGGKV